MGRRRGRYRDPEEDLPADFEGRREGYYGELGVPMEADRFVEALREEMRAALGALDSGLPKDLRVSVSGHGGGRIVTSPLEKQPTPPNLGQTSS